MFRKILALWALLIAVPAHAQWIEAESKNFIVYSDASEKEVRQTSERLEKYFYILKALTNSSQAAAPVKVKVYMLRDTDAVERLAGEGVWGFYFATPRTPVAIGARRAKQQVSTNRTVVHNTSGLGEEVLQHELAHHFMYQYFPTSYPTWYSEGFAEFFGSMAFPQENVAELGHAPGYRIEQARSDWLAMEKLLSARNYAEAGDSMISLYAQGWLLVHYAFNNPERGKQLNQYLREVSAGKPYGEAAKSAFGDLDKLDKEMRAHLKGGVNALRLPLKPIDIGPLAVRKLTPLENALLRSDMFLNFSVPVKEADDIARLVASQVGPGSTDAYGLRILTEAHRAAEQNDKAMAAVDRWLAAHPRDPKAMMHKSMIEMAMLRAAGSNDAAAWEKLRARIVEANKLAPEDPEILIAFYDSYQGQGMLPPAPAQNALMSAFKLVPQDRHLRHRVAADFEARDMLEEAIYILQPLANSFHSKEESGPKAEERRRRQWEKNRAAGQVYMETPRQMMERLEKKLAERKGGSADAEAASN